MSRPRTIPPSCEAQRGFFPIQLKSARLAQIFICTILADATRTVAASVQTQTKVMKNLATLICQKLATRRTDYKNAGFRQSTVRFNFSRLADFNLVIRIQPLEISLCDPFVKLCGGQGS